MTIKIQVYKRFGIEEEKMVDKYEFCCWVALNKWLNSGFFLYDCAKCRKNKNGGENGK